MKHCSEVLSIYKTFSVFVRTHFATSIHVFCADSVGVYLSEALRQVLAEKGYLDQFSCPGAHAKNGVVERECYGWIEVDKIGGIGRSPTASKRELFFLAC
jgi:hypothetical protein